MNQIESWFANKRQRTANHHNGSKLPEKAKTIVKYRKFPRGAAEVLQHYFEHCKRYYPTAPQRQILANKTVRHCLCLACS